jgi:hypothetical protein
MSQPYKTERNIITNRNKFESIFKNKYQNNFPISKNNLIYQKNMLKQKQKHYTDLDTDIDKIEDLELNPKIKEQLKDIDEQIEIIGKVCDTQYKNSYNMLKNILDKESQKVDNDIKNYISNLRNQLIQFKNKLNFDYKGKYKEVTKQLNEMVQTLNKNKGIKNDLEKKHQVLIEDCVFYERQLDNIKDMNSYLKYKLKMALKNYNQISNEFININDETERNKENEETKKKIVKKNEDDFLITGLQEYELEEKPEENNTINKNKSKEILGENKKFSEEQIEKVKKRFNYMTQKLFFDIENEKIEYANLKEVFDKLYIKTNNMYMNILKNTHNEQKMNNSATNNSNSNINNQSTLPSIYQSTNASRSSNRINKPKEGFMSKKISKEIIINFLEKEEIKKIIYKMLYED